MNFDQALMMLFAASEQAALPKRGHIECEQAYGMLRGPVAELAKRAAESTPKNLEPELAAEIAS